MKDLRVAMHLLQYLFNPLVRIFMILHVLAVKRVMCVQLPLALLYYVSMGPKASILHQLQTTSFSFLNFVQWLAQKAVQFTMELSLLWLLMSQ